jgi:hypothetical protein
MMSKQGFAKVWILVLLGALGAPPAHSGGRGNPKETESLLARQVLNKATAFLQTKQSTDGAWRSETYGLLKSGQSLTPFVLFALTDSLSDNREPNEDSIQKAISFLRTKSAPNGVHGRADPDFLDYPNYSTAYALRCFLRFGNEEDRPRIDKMTSYLEGQQFSENFGFEPSSPAYGGWGFGINQRPTLSSFVDLSHTRRVLASLAQAKPITLKVRVRAERFLALLQKSPTEKRSPLIRGYTKEKTGRAPHDGGFFSSPNVAYANKGRTEVDPKTGRTYYRSYATATCDGILSLLALGIDKSDPRVTNAARWLRANEDWNLPSGIPLDDPSPWAESMRYYHLMVRAEAYAALDMSGHWRKTLVRFLADKQLPDGSFLNPEGRLMKEDDPMLCTAFAVIALKGIIYDAIED